MIDEAGSARNIQGNTGQALIHGGQGRSVAGDPLLVTQGLFHGVPQADAQILDQMVVIHFPVSLTGDLEVKKTMPSQKIQHMIHERNLRVDLTPADAVEFHLHGNVGFPGLSLDLALAHPPSSL